MRDLGYTSPYSKQVWFPVSVCTSFVHAKKGTIYLLKGKKLVTRRVTNFLP